MKKNLLYPMLVGCLLGCQSTPEVTQEAAAAPSPSQPQQEQTATANDIAQHPSARTNGDYAYLSGQLTTLQEQVIQIRANTAELKKNLQVVLARMQMPTGQSIPVAQNSAATGPDPQLDRLNQQINSLLEQTEGSFALASGYTAKGQWVLIRYDRYTGETWLADKGSWIALQEQDVIQPSLFSIQIRRADKDIKGYVAARVDQRSGETWWLKQNRWLIFQ